MRPQLVVGIDPGYRSLGFAAIALPKDPASPSLRLDAIALISTEPTTGRKGRVLSASDNTRRCREIFRTLRALVAPFEQTHRLVAIAIESLQTFGSIESSTKAGAGFGACCAVAEALGVPMFEVEPKDAKVALAGRPTATKDEVEAGVRRAITHVVGFGGIEAMVAGIPRGRMEHPMDAAAIAITVARSAEVTALRRMVG